MRASCAAWGSSAPVTQVHLRELFDPTRALIARRGVDTVAKELIGTAGTQEDVDALREVLIRNCPS